VTRAATWLLSAGVLLFIGVLASQGLPAVVATLALAGWGLLRVALFHLLPLVLDAAAIRVLFDGSAARGSMLDALLARWAGESANSLMPGGQIGGPVRRCAICCGSAVRSSRSAMSRECHGLRPIFRTTSHGQPARCCRGFSPCRQCANRERLEAALPPEESAMALHASGPWWWRCCASRLWGSWVAAAIERYAHIRSVPMAVTHGNRIKRARKARASQLLTVGHIGALLWRPGSVSWSARCPKTARI
jgi:hypothetical protein